MSLNPETAEVEIRPRDVDARIEVDWYASVDNPGVADLEKAAKEFFGKATTTFSPFDRGTFEPLLRTASYQPRRKRHLLAKRSAGRGPHAAQAR